MGRQSNKRRYSQKKLPKLVERNGGLCHWCQQPIVIVRFIKNKIIKNTGKMVTWIQDGIEKRCRLATVDHIISLGAGGTNAMTNLVPACFTCNHKRNDIIMKRDRPKGVDFSGKMP